MESQQNPNPTKRSHQSSAGATAQGAGSHKTGAGSHRGSRPGGKFNKRLLYCLTPATDVGRGDTKRHRTARLWMLCAEGVVRKDIMRKFACIGNALHTLSRHNRPILQGPGPVNPYISMMRDSQSTLIWSSVPHANKTFD